MRADAATMRRSHASASPKPAPAAGPFTAAITGFSQATTLRTHVPTHAYGSSRSTRVDDGSVGGSERSRPAQNARPAPVITTTRTASSAAASATAEENDDASAPLTAFSFSERSSVRVRTPSAEVSVSRCAYSAMRNHARTRCACRAASFLGPWSHRRDGNVARELGGQLGKTDEIRPVAVAIVAARPARELEHGRPRQLAGIRRVAKQHAEAGDRAREAHRLGGLPAACRHGMVHQLAAITIRGLPPHRDVQQLVAGRTRFGGTLIAELARLVQRDVARHVGAHDLVHRGHHVAGADLARVLRIVREVL